MTRFAFTLALAALTLGWGAPAFAEEAAAKHDHAKMEMNMDMGGEKSVAKMDCCEQAKEAGMVCLMCDPKAKAELGKPAPSFMLKDAAGKQLTLADNKGKVIILAWYNPECPYIVRHLKAGTFTKLRGEFPQDKVAVILVDSSNFATAASEQGAIGEYKLTMPVALDPEGKVGRAYSAKTTPHVFVIDQHGKLAYDGAMDNNPLGNKPAGEVVNYAEQTARALLAGQPVKTASTKPYGCGVKYEKKTAALNAPRDITLASAEPLCGSGSCGGGNGGDDGKDAKDGKKDDKQSGKSGGQAQG